MSDYTSSDYYPVYTDTVKVNLIDCFDPQGLVRDTDDPLNLVIARRPNGQYIVLAGTMEVQDELYAAMMTAEADGNDAVFMTDADGNVMMTMYEGFPCMIDQDPTTCRWYIEAE